MKKASKRLLYIGFLLVPVIAAACGTIVYCMLYMPNFKVAGTKYVYIYEDNKDFKVLCEELRDSADCKNIKLFELLAAFRKYPENMKPGRFSVEPGMNNNTLLNRLRRGQQAPVRLTFNNIRQVSDLTDRLSDQLMLESDELLAYLNDEAYCESLGFNTVTIKTMFIPNTYEVYWNIPADKLMERMKREYDTFWTTDRRKKADNIYLSPVEVSILASIVEEETAVPDEYPAVAGLYINRLIKGMPLQADPTVKYAVGDFSLKRILNKHLTVESPYNTYLHEGLPPGPIRFPSVKGLDAVLNYAHHNYLYMCAKEDFSGRHNFAVTLKEHNRNADKYRAELNRRGIR
ncbi:MAG: endolytic transglycosylase MltG [Tannerella sp.]|jgi:UPF0755 protein|nr:endolytic transglycosylase MltG [Tannerella sp.]